MKSRLSALVFVLILSAMIVSGCGTTTAEPTTGLANPASVYCEGQGYTLEMRTDADGGQYGVCIFPDGSECEEWAFYRDECSPASSTIEQPAETPTTAPTEAVTAQPAETPAPVEPAETWVYVDLMPDESGTTVTWIDSLSGAANSVPAPGTRYQVIGEWVYYQEGTGGTVHRVNEAGQDERFDFMDIPEDNFETVDWAISPDGTRIVWNRFSFETVGNEITLTSDLYIATIATGETRLLTTYVVHEHQKLTPWGFSPDGSQVFVYLQPYGIGGLFAVYGEFSMLDVSTGQLTSLPDPMGPEPMGGAAAISDDGARLARFGHAEGQGFKVNLIELANGQTTEVATPSTDLGLVQVGDGVFSPDGSTLVYTVAYGDWGSEGFALVQVDTTTGTQREILAPQSTHYRVAHFEDGGSLLLTIAWPGEGTGTFRLHPDGTLGHLTEATLVGVSQATETAAPTAGEPVACWYGRVESTPEYAALDRYLVLLPEELRQAVDAVGADEAIEAEIEGLRDSGIYAHFWGTLNCDVPGWGGCRLVVTRLRAEGPEGPFFDPDPVEGWTGSIFSIPDDAQFDDYFVLSGNVRAHYGIDSTDAAIAAQLESLRDTGSIVRVWGQVTCPAIDFYGTEIRVARLEVVSEAPAEEEGYEGWNTYMSEKFGYALRYPGECTVMGILDEAVTFSGPLVDNEHWLVLTVSHYDSDFYHPPAGADLEQWIVDHVMSYDEIDTEVEIAGLPAVHLVHEAGPGWGASDDYYFIRGDQLFSILILHTGGQQDWDLYNKFLQSFTFP